jgi:hypothetical protein
MYLTAFGYLFPDRVETETRVITTRGYPGLPDDDYALLESYCTDPRCDCRRVMINVLGRRQGPIQLATISFAFDPDADLRGPFLDPLNPQSDHSPILLDLVTAVLEDPPYLARLESHYDDVKRLTADPNHPAHRSLRRAQIADAKRLANRAKRKRGRR